MLYSSSKEVTFPLESSNCIQPEAEPSVRKIPCNFPSFVKQKIKGCSGPTINERIVVPASIEDSGK